MPCVKFSSGIVCIAPFFRLPLSDGRRLFMEYHSYFGPTFFADRAATREIAEWWNDAGIVEALKWFEGRGKRA